MTDWLTNLTPKERHEWDEFVEHSREETFKNMERSAFIMSLIPKDGKVDVKFCVELGMAIMLDKPIIAVAIKGTRIPDTFLKICQEVVELEQDIDTEQGAKEAASILKDTVARLTGK